MKKVLLILMAVALSFGIMACDSPPEAKPTTTLSLDQVSTRLGNVENRLAQAESKLSTSTNTELVAQINALKTDVAQLKNDLAGMEAPDLSVIQTQLDDILTNYETVTARLDENTSNISILAQDIEDIEIPEQVLTEEELTDLTNSIASLQALTADLVDTVADLTQRIEAMEGTTPPTTTVSKDIDYEIVKYGDPVLKDGEDSISYLFRLNITNTGTVDLEDIGIAINFIANDAPAFTGTPALTGSTVYWGKASQETGLVQFVSGWGSVTPSTRLALAAGESKSYYLKWEAGFDTATDDVLWTLETYIGYLN